MKSLRHLSLSIVCLTLFLANVCCAQDAKPDEKKDPSTKALVSGSAPSTSTSSSAISSAAPYAAILKDAKPVTGVLPLYRKGNRLYAELSSTNYASQYIILISIARGIGDGMLLGGMTWGFGDDWVWQFRKVDDRVHIIRKNTRFRAKKGSPEATAVAKAYSDSVLFSLPVMSKGPKGGDLVDLTPVFMSDLPQIAMYLPGFVFSPTKSTWASVKGFKDNVELQVAATYASSGRFEYDTIPDSRGATINVHYSISRLTSTGYKPRVADDRVGYFITVAKDYSKQTDRDYFVRYINRWDLQKADPTANPSPPKKPIIFWIEKTVPFKYRSVVRAGIEEWNKAFEKAGFVNAIEVRQQPNDADWDPEDINYNTFRWITANAGFAMGPSRVNPYTGQILDADIIFDADFLQYWKREFETMSPKTIAAMTGGPFGLHHEITSNKEEHAPHGKFNVPHNHKLCMLGHGMRRQYAFGSAAMSVRMADPKAALVEQEKLIMQGLKEVVMHEVGHTLGLRHNFKASKMLSLKDINDPAKAKDGIVASVMDYNATNIVPKDAKQGDYFTTTIGPYDYWAIEYGYKTLSIDDVNFRFPRQTNNES